MKKGPVDIPYEAFGRTIEFREYEPLTVFESFKAKLALKFYNMVSHMLPVNHFENIAEFRENQGSLKKEDRVAFRELDVVSRIQSDGMLELYVSDGPGVITLEYPLPEEVTEDEMIRYALNDPVFGSEKGDKIELYDSLYRARDCLRVLDMWLVRNDSHYNRWLEKKKEYIEQLKLADSLLNGSSSRSRRKT